MVTLSMVWCVNCAQDKPTKDVEGKICCSFCGKVLEEDNFSIEPTFVKNASGQSQLSGSRVNTIQSNYSVSRERTLKEAYEGIEGMLYGLGIDGGDSIARPALSFYTIAVEKSFTRGRRKEQVQAACLYIACRENKKPFLLIDFSEYLRINVYVLGAVFLQLCKILHLEDHPIVQKPVDPSLFIHRFTDRGLDGRSEPPSFQRAERERLMAKQDAEEIVEDPSFPMSSQMENNVGEYLEPEKEGNTQSVKNVHISGSEQVGACSVAKTDHIATPDTLHGMDGIDHDDHDESGNFSDIDDVEVDSYLHNEQEKKYKKIIWETMNREYLEEQAAKEAAVLEAKKQHEFILANCPEDVQKFAAATAASVAKSKKEKQQKRAAELKNTGPAQTAAEATKQMLAKKRLSNKINYDVLEKLFDDSAPENPKKARTAYDSTDDYGVKSDKIDPEVDENYEHTFGEDVHYGEDVGGYDYDQDYDLDDY